MANVMEYLDWRGDIPLGMDGFNEVDNYICSQMGMPDFSLLVPEDGRTIRLSDALEHYGELWGERGDILGVLSSPHVLPLLRRAAETRRFGAVELSHFVNLRDEELSEQFSAVCIHLPDGSHYIAYRGTDDTLTGWKEDFLLCVLDKVPAQTDALAYLCRVAEEVEGPLVLGGHSKGGNLAMYAAIHAPREIQQRISMVYSNDGPGFRQEETLGEGYERMASRLVTIMPQHSIVGILFTALGETRIVESIKTAPDSHDGYHWKVMGREFVRCEELSRSSRALEEAVDQTMAGMSREERKEFVDALFEALESSGARTLTELSEQGFRRTLEMLRMSRRSPALQSFLSSVTELTVRELAGEAVEDMRERMPELRRPLLRRLVPGEEKEEGTPPEAQEEEDSPL